MTGSAYAKVRTNTMPDSICKLGIEPVTFQMLWDNYVTGDPYRDPKTGQVPPGYDNQCAIRLSATLHKVGVEMKSFTSANVTVKPGQPFGRILLNGRNTAVKADQLGSWLSKQPFCGLPQRPEDVTGRNWQSKVKGRTGIIMFDGYWARDGEGADSASGGHIDLWNGKRMAVSGIFDSVAVIGRYFGAQSLFPGTRLGFSDLRNARSILFWEIK